MVGAMSDNALQGKGLIGQAPPTAVGDNTWTAARQTKYNERFAVQIGTWQNALANQGSYFTAHNPVIDVATTIVGHAAPILADCDVTMTKPLIHLRMSPTATTKAYLNFIEIEVVVAPTNGAKDNWAAQLDTGATRVTTPGTTLTALNTNMQSTGAASTPGLIAQAGAIVVGAESVNVRNLGFGQNRSGIAILGDRYMYRFGGDPSSGDNVVSAAASRHLINMPPVILGPSGQFLLALYSSDDAQTIAGVYKVRMGWWEI